MGYRIDQKAEQTTLTGTDLMLVETDPTNTKIYKKMKISTFFTNITQFVFAKSVAPSNPDSGYVKLYADTYGKIQVLGSSGVSRKLQPRRYVAVEIFPPGDNCTTGDGKKYIHIPSDCNEMFLTEIHAFCITAGTTGTMDIQIRNVTDAQDMLSTKLTIDSTETDSSNAATAAVINSSYDAVATNDILAIDVDAVHTTPAKGLVVTLGFTFPSG
jgi:hypothetical protein